MWYHTYTTYFYFLDDYSENIDSNHKNQTNESTTFTSSSSIDTDNEKQADKSCYDILFRI